MASWQIKKLFITIITLVSLVFLIVLSSTGAFAQVPPGDPSTPTPEGRGKSGGGGGGVPPPPPGAMVSGFVYNYSSAAHEGGVTVVIEGDGWIIQAITDSEGFYQAGNLKTGYAVVNLNLPVMGRRGPKAVTTNWPVRLLSGVNERVDLGLYWGENPPIPVILSANLDGNRLNIQVDNNTRETATGGVVRILPPSNITVSPSFQTSQGLVNSYDPYDFQVDLSSVKAGGNVTVQTLLEQVDGISQNKGDIRVVFTYDQQITPQVIELPSSFQPVIISAQAEIATSSDTTVTPSRVQDSTSSGSSTSQEFTPSTPVPLPTNASSSDVVTDNKSKAKRFTPLPVTGNNIDGTNITMLLLSILLMLGLVVGGWHSLRRFY